MKKAPKCQIDNRRVTASPEFIGRDHITRTVYHCPDCNRVWEQVRGDSQVKRVDSCDTL